MIVLHLLSQTEVTGAETYVESLVGELSRRGHRFLVASDTLTRTIQANYRPVRLHRRGWYDRYKNIREVAAIVRSENVSLIHAHSRASSWVGSFVSKACGIPLITTIHGMQPIHLSRKWFPAFGCMAIAVCKNIQDQLLFELGVNRKNVRIIPNGIDLSKYASRSISEVSMPVLLFVGRLSGPKLHALKRFMFDPLEELLSRSPDVEFHLIGRMEDGEGIGRIVQKLQGRFGKRCISFMGYQGDVASAISPARAVIGSGRVVLEAMAMKKPVVSLGETDYLGVLTPEGFHRACLSNFGDCSPREQLAFEGAGEELAKLLADPTRCRELGEWGRKAVEAFDIRKVADDVEGIYKQCLSSRS
jgi:glycosyltransferase involved in cell wall biosynthesis